MKEKTLEEVQKYEKQKKEAEQEKGKRKKETEKGKIVKLKKMKKICEGFFPSNLEWVI